MRIIDDRFIDTGIFIYLVQTRVRLLHMYFTGI